jgi:hypothetical protein
MTERQKQQLRYAAYANHCGIRKHVPLTWRAWIKAGGPKT